MFTWFKSERRERRRKVRLDRKRLEERARRFLKAYLNADAALKPQFYRAVEYISQKCHPSVLVAAQPDLDNAKVAEATSQAAMKMFLESKARLKKDNRSADFFTDACATVAIAYDRAAGIYVGDEKMQELGTAAVHLLSMATSYTHAQNNDGA